MSLRDGEQCSDDDDVVFCGWLTPTENVVSQQSNKRQTIATDGHPEEDGHNTSLTLISTHSAPDITSKQNCATSPDTIPKMLSSSTLAPDEPNGFADWDVRSSDSLERNLEKMVEKSCAYSSMEFDNTLEEIEYILNNRPINDNKIPPSNDCKIAESEANKLPRQNNVGKSALNTKPSAVIPSIKQCQKEKVFSTASSVLTVKPSTSRTPTNSPLFKKPSLFSLKKTPNKNDAFQHVASPVAYYINNSPQMPLIRNVHPKKTLSRIPKLVKSTTTTMQSHKENVNLPSVAYKSAKKTTVIDVSNGPKMPQCQWAKELTESLPNPAVIKHVHREESQNKPTSGNPEESFGDLSLHQADISICTKRNAF